MNRISTKLIYLATIFSTVIGCKSRQASMESNVEYFEPNITSQCDFDSKKLVMTFDDGPAENTLAIANHLNDFGMSNYGKPIKGTFFVRGDRIAKPSGKRIMEQVAALGHRIGNHGTTHRNLDSIHVRVARGEDKNDGFNKSMEQVKKEIMDTQWRIEDVVARSGEQFTLFRAPMGRLQGTRAKWLDRQGDMKNLVGTINWDYGGAISGRVTADFKCWNKGMEPKECAQNLMEEIETKECKNSNGESITPKGGIVLMHDDRPLTIDMVKEFLALALQNGYSFADLTDVPRIRDILTSEGYSVR